MKRLEGSNSAYRLTWFLAALLAAPLPAGIVSAAPEHDDDGGPPATVSVFASGLNNPRGLKFGPDGNLYVAEGGTGGTNSTVGLCDQVPSAGPYLGSPTGSRVSKIDANGVLTTVVEGLPSSQTAASLGSFVSGVADVAFVDGTLYALITGAGCSHGVPGTSNGVLRVHPDGTWEQVADLSAFYKAHPVAHPEPDDFEPDGTPYSMIALRGDLYVVEPNHGELDRVRTDGEITRVVDISASQGHIVPTAIAYRGSFYVGNLNTFPIVPGSSKVLRITPGGQMKVAAEGFTTVLGVAFDDDERMYVLENTTGNNVPPLPTPHTGRIVRVSKSGARKVIASGLFLPTAMTFGPDGSLYVSNVGFGPPPIGLGEILKVTLED